MNRTTKFAVAGIGLLAAVLGTALGAPQARAQQAEVKLRLVDPTSPGLLLANETSVEAEDIHYKIALWNADNLRDGHKVLPIPGSGLVHLAPHSTYGPISLFDEPDVRSWLKSGNRIVGNIGVTCQTCARGFTYWFLITWGKGGWFSEVTDMTDGSVIVPRLVNGAPIRDYVLQTTLLGRASEVDQQNRIPIAPLGDGR